MDPIEIQGCQIQKEKKEVEKRKETCHDSLIHCPFKLVAVFCWGSL